MEKINIKDININSLQRLANQGSKSITYTDGNTCYKVLTGLYTDEKEVLEDKFQELSSLHIDKVLMPKDLIVKDGLLEGYTMDYFKDSKNLSDFYSTRFYNIKDLFESLKEASKILRKIHDSGIIYQDLSFENILINKDKEIRFCDIDGCSYKYYNAPFISLLLKCFLLDYRKEKVYLSKDLDKLSMLVSFYDIIFDEEINHISKRQYKELSNNVVTLKESRELFETLLNKKSLLTTLPYLDEIIDDSDDYIVDREKLLTLKRKIFRF